MGEFRRDLNENLDAIAFTRKRLLEEIRELSANDLQRVRRGGWSVREVLRHLIDSEVAYTKVVGFLRDSPTDLPNASDDDIASGSAAATALDGVRRRMVALLEGIDESTFYDLRTLGKEQYSVVSVLENVASHDQEHLEQITKTLGHPASAAQARAHDG